MLGKKTGGRQRGTKNKRTEQIEAQLAAAAAKVAVEAATLTPLDLILSIMRDPDTPLALRADMAAEAAPYVHPRLSAVEQSMTAKVEVEPVLKPLPPREVRDYVAGLLANEETMKGLPPPNGMSDADRLKRAMTAGPVHPDLYAAMAADEDAY
jgi:hypothetical protein